MSTIAVLDTVAVVSSADVDITGFVVSSVNVEVFSLVVDVDVVDFVVSSACVVYSVEVEGIFRVVSSVGVDVISLVVSSVGVEVISLVVSSIGVEVMSWFVSSVDVEITVFVVSNHGTLLDLVVLSVESDVVVSAFIKNIIIHKMLKLYKLIIDIFIRKLV